jgi:hypothetical protein
MDSIIFYTDLDRVIGCTKGNSIKGEPFCDACQENCGFCRFKWQYKTDVQHNLNTNERQLKATFIKLYLEKTLRILQRTG